MVEECPKCINFRRMRNLPLHQTELPEALWSHVPSDLFEFRGKFYALFVSNPHFYSRWIEVAEMSGQTGAELAKKFRPVIARYGGRQPVLTSFVRWGGGNKLCSPPPNKACQDRLGGRIMALVMFLKSGET